MAVVPAAGRADRAPSEPAAQAASVLFERYRARIHAYCLHQLRSREEAEDATQTTFMNAFRGLERGVVPESEQAWLFKIAENVCLSRRRSSWRRGRIESPSDFELIEELVPSPSRDLAEELIGLQDALEAMPETQRRAILLREWQGLSYREIAEELELSQAAVETLIFRARRTLATGLEEPPAPKRRRRALLGGGLNVGSLLAALKEVFVGSTAAKAVAVAVAATSTTVAATNLPERDGDPRPRGSAPAQVASQPRPAAAAPVLRQDSAPKPTARPETPKAQAAKPKPKRVEQAASRPQPATPVVLETAVAEEPAAAPVAAPVDEPAPAPAAEHAAPKAKPAEAAPQARALQSETSPPAHAQSGKQAKPEKDAEHGPPAEKKGPPANEAAESKAPVEPGPPADKLPEQARAEAGPPEHAAAGGKAKGQDKGK